MMMDHRHIELHDWLESEKAGKMNQHNGGEASVETADKRQSETYRG